MPWGASLIPVDELERLARERRRTAKRRLERATLGRKPTVTPEVAKRIPNQRSAGESLRQIATDLNAARIPTAHGGTRWWPSTVRMILQSRSPYVVGSYRAPGYSESDWTPGIVSDLAPSTR